MKNLNYLAPINQTGYGIAATNIYYELCKLYDVALFPMGGIDGVDINASLIQAGLNLSTFFDVNAPCVKIWHQHDMSTFVGKGEHIAFPFFELTEFNRVEEHHLKSVDRIFTSCQWAKNVIINQGIKNHDKIDVVPLGINPHNFRKLPAPKNLPTTTKFFTCGKWEKRKGHDILLEAFNKAFKPEDNVSLHMMCDNSFIGVNNLMKWKNMYANSRLGSKIRFLPRVKTHNEVLNIMSNMDCGVYISRAEGWNLELLETMSCGVPVITTNYSGHTEFCNDKNSYLVDIDNLEVAEDGFWFKSGIGSWAELGNNQVDQIVEHMRYVHKNKPYNEEGVRTGQKFTWENSANIIFEKI